MKSGVLLTIVILLATPVRAQIDSFKTGGVMRSFLVHAPSVVSRPALLISLHGAIGDGAVQQSRTEFDNIADREKFIVVYPNSNYTTGSHLWNLSGDEDVVFLCALIDTMIALYSVDRRRVYCNGFSLGGMMTYHLACRAAGKLAAIVSVSGPCRDNPCNPAYPIPVMHIHGRADNTINYSNAVSTVNQWTAQFSCTQPPVVIDHYPADQPQSKAKKEYWGPCDHGSEVILISVEGLDHSWPNLSNSGFNASEEIWSFLKNHTLPEGIASTGGIRPILTFGSKPGNMNPGNLLPDNACSFIEAAAYNLQGIILERWTGGGNGNDFSSAGNILFNRKLQQMIILRTRTPNGRFSLRTVSLNR